MAYNLKIEDTVPEIIYVFSWLYLLLVGMAGITLNVVALTKAIKVSLKKLNGMINLC